MTTTTLTVIDRTTGEAIDVVEAGDADLGTFLDNLTELRAELAEAEGIVNGELIRRLDRSASWTRRVRISPDVELEISAPSPDAGTEAYDPALLEAELLKLVERRTIDETGAAAALDRTVSIVVRVPLADDLKAIVDQLQAAESFTVAGVDVEPIKAEASRSVKLGGVAKLRKLDGTGAALDRAKLTKPAPSRRVKIKRNTRQ